VADACQFNGSGPVRYWVSLYRLYEKQRRSVSNSYAVVSTLAARRQGFRKNNKERLR
jgi:hypothetical protein